MPRKDYQKRQLNNPFFKKKQIKKKKKIFIISLIILASFSLLVYFLFYSPIFIISNIKIEGNNRTEDFLIEDLAWQISQERRIFDIRADNLWFFPKKRLKDEMFLRLDLTNITIKRRLFNRLIIEVKEREALFILKNDDFYQFRDELACPIHLLEPSNEDLLIYPIVEKDKLSENDLKNCFNLYDGYINDILKLFNLSNKLSDFSIDKFIINSEKFNIISILKEGPRIYFSRREDFTKQLEKLTLIILELENEIDLTEINYIDVRYGDKAFINYK